jgi:hypothetical protein
MDTVWRVREAYNTARKIKDAQDDYCAKARSGHWAGLGEFPEDFQWESTVALLRGQIKVQTHCYEATGELPGHSFITWHSPSCSDIANFVRLTQEFGFPVAAFHHAHEAYLVPDVLKSAYGVYTNHAICSVTNWNLQGKLLQLRCLGPSHVTKERLFVIVNMLLAFLQMQELML